VTARRRRAQWHTGCGENFPGALESLEAETGEAFAPGAPVEVVRPLQFRCSVPVEGIIEEAPADLVLNQGFPAGAARARRRASSYRRVASCHQYWRW
jgi:hypothetical protein